MLLALTRVADADDGCAEGAHGTKCRYAMHVQLVLFVRWHCDRREGLLYLVRGRVLQKAVTVEAGCFRHNARHHHECGFHLFVRPSAVAVLLLEGLEVLKLAPCRAVSAAEGLE